MDKAEALAHFEENYVQAKLIEKLLQTEEYFRSHQDELADEFLRSVGAIGMKINLMQSKGEIGKVGYINYGMLRSSILDRSPIYRINVYNKEWYFDREQKECQGEYDGNSVFRFLDELETELDEPRKRYFGAISPVDLELVKLREAAKFNQFIIHLAGYALNKGDSIEELSNIAKEEEFEVRVGEYYDLSEVVYKEDTRGKGSEAVKEWLEDKHEDQYVAAVLKNLDLSGGDYGGIDLRRVDFSGSRLRQCGLQECLLIKAGFRKCLLNDTDFSGAMIHDADFSGANLKGAAFFGAEGSRGIREALISGIYSLSGVNFAGANLTETDFRYANLPGADFRNANFQNTDFQGANLKNARFSESDLEQVDFTEEQRESVVWVKTEGEG